ncbi:hypothetical protein IAT40_004090 [Kwoniella sp. CBS 6097]
MSDPNLPRPPAEGHSSARLALPKQQTRSTGYTYPIPVVNPADRAHKHVRSANRADASRRGLSNAPQEVRSTYSPSKTSHEGVGDVRVEEDDGDWGNVPYYVESKSEDQSEERSIKTAMPHRISHDEQGNPQDREETPDNEDEVEARPLEAFRPLNQVPLDVEEEDDGGWGSGRTSAPSQPFNVGEGRRGLYTSSTKTGAVTQGQGPDLSSTKGCASSSAYRSTPEGGQVQESKSAIDGRRRQPANLQMTSRFVQRSISNTYTDRVKPLTTSIPLGSNLDIASTMTIPPFSQIDTHADAPTYDGPNNGPAHLREAGSRDANRIVVPGLRPWGKAAPHPEEGRFEDANPTDQREAASGDNQGPHASPPAGDTPLWSSIGSPGEIAWDKEDRLQKWAKSIPNISPEDSHPPTVLSSTTVPEEPAVDEPVPSRPSSVIEPAMPVTLEYSEDEDDAEDPTPALTPHRSNSPAHEPEEVSDPALRVHKTAVKAPAVLSVTVGEDQAPIQPPSPVETQTTGRGTRSHGPRSNRNGPNKEWWKRSPHPMYSAKFAAQRIFVQLPSPIRLDQLKPNMLDHFSRYGQVRAVFHYEATGTSCEKAFVVFEEAEAVKRVFADPDRHKFRFRSSHGSRVACADLEIFIKHSPASHISRAILIRLAGPRADEKARSASPPPLKKASTIGRDLLSSYHTTTLPDHIVIDAVPQRSNDGFRIFWWARVRPVDQTFEALRGIAKAHTGREPKKIGEIDLRRRVAEKDIIPSLCNYFAEVVDIYPPTARGQGWLVTVSGPQEARHLMNELQQLPGFFVRWADETDGYYPNDGPEVAPWTTQDEPATPVSPVTRLHNQMEGRPSRPSRHNGPTSRIASDIPANPHATSQPSPPRTYTNDLPAAQAPAIEMSTPFPAIVQPQAQLGYSPNHPLLRRGLIYTYRGRVLIEDMSTGEPRYIDERAIFVGRLDKGRETASTLLKRFEKYGKVCAVEYNPMHSSSTYASARILFQEKDSADHAIVMENNATSFGSAIKVNVRKVLPSDVETKEMYIDDLGRAISPSMVSQYSPKSAHMPQRDNLIPMPPVSLPPQAFGPYTNPPAYPSMAYPYPAPIPYMPVLPTYPVNMYYPQPMLDTTNIPALQPNGPPPLPVQNTPINDSFPQHLQYPMLCAAWGVGYVPAGATLGPTPFYPPRQPPPGPTPPLSPGTMAPPPAPVPIGVPTPGPSPPSQPSELEMPDGLICKSKLLPIGFKEEDGMVKAIYDQEALNAYYEEAGLSPPAQKKAELPAHADEPLTLLPIQTGRHDPSSRFQTSIPSDQARSTIHLSDRSLPVSGLLPHRERQHLHQETRTVPIPIPFSPAQSTTQGIVSTPPIVVPRGQDNVRGRQRGAPRHTHRSSDLTAHSLRSERITSAILTQQTLPPNNRWSSGPSMDRDLQHSQPTSVPQEPSIWAHNEADSGGREERGRNPERRPRGRGRGGYASSDITQGRHPQLPRNTR